MPGSRLRLSDVTAWLFLATSMSIAAEPVWVGFAAVDITPSVAVDAPPVWLAGYGQNRRATGVHDPLFARAVVLSDGKRKVAMVAVDLVGLMRPAVLEARKKLGDFEYVLVASTHNHEGPDVIGLWGPSPFVTGVDRDYITLVVDRIVQAVREAEKAAQPARAVFGTSEDENLLGDSRQPVAKDGVLRVLRFDHADTGKPIGILVQWNCHPESMGSRNTLVTADFPWATIKTLKERHGCEVAFFSGAIGGLMAPPEDHFKDPQGNPYREGDFAWTEAYGVMVADLADKALASAEPLNLWPPSVAQAEVIVPVSNTLYQLASSAKVIDRPVNSTDGTSPPGITTEVAILTLGELNIAAIPGELYPELVYGKFQDPADPAADFRDAPLETPVMDRLPPGKRMLIGLANDEIGYIIPKRQWDQQPPFAYGRSKSQYGEVNSVGPEAAPILMKALHQLNK